MNVRRRISLFDSRFRFVNRTLIGNLLLVFSILLGCASTPEGKRVPLYTPPLQTTSDSALSQISISEIVILPLGVPAGRAVSLTAMQSLQPELISAFEAHTSFRVLNNERPEEVLSAIEAVQKSAIAPRERASRFGRILSADAVLFGEVTRLEESDGGKFGAQRPSAVSFSLQLLEVQTGTVLWSAGFDRKDESLTDNLFRLPEIARDGMQFHSVGALARQGFQDAAKDLEIKYRGIEQKKLPSRARSSGRVGVGR